MSSEKEKRSKTLDNLYYYGLRATFLYVVNKINGTLLDEAQTKADYMASFPIKSTYFKIISPTRFIFDEAVYTLSKNGEFITIEHRDNTISIIRTMNDD